MSNYTREQLEQQDTLRALLSPGQTVYTSLDHVSRSGMSRRISLYIVVDGSIRDITWHAAKAGVGKLHREGGIVMGGCGMDMGFALVYNLGRALYPNGVPCTGSKGYTPTGRKAKAPRCGSNDHVNGDRVYRKGKLHGDSGYAFKQEWLKPCTQLSLKCGFTPVHC